MFSPSSEEGVLTRTERLATFAYRGNGHELVGNLSLPENLLEKCRRLTPSNCAGQIFMSYASPFTKSLTLWETQVDPALRIKSSSFQPFRHRGQEGNW